VTPYLADWDVTLHLGDACSILRQLEDSCCDAVVSSPPYLNARPEYPSPTGDEFSAIFTELRRVCTGTMLLNVGRLWRERKELLWWTELIERAGQVGWPHRDTVVWIKQNANPFQGEVVTNAHELLLLFGDGFDGDAVRTEYDEESLLRMKRKFVNHAGVKNDVNVIDKTEMEVREPNEKGARCKSYVIFPTGKEKGNEHPAPMPLELAEYLVRLSGGKCVLDPFAGSGTTLLAARNLGRTAIGVELSSEYAEMCSSRLSQQTLPI
jgi:DNA modification methylase